MKYIDEDPDLQVARAFENAHKEKKVLTEAQIMKRYWRNMNERVKTKSYIKKGIKVVWTFEEFSSWWSENLKIKNDILSFNLTPSIDRIDSNKHYETNNCRWLPVEVNRALGEVEGLISRMKTLQIFLEENKQWLKN